MKIDDYSLPHPIIKPNGNILGGFSVSINTRTSKDEVLLTAKFLLDNKILEKLVKEKKAAFCIDVSCMYTMYREHFVSTENDFSESIPAVYLRDTVEVNCLLVAISDIDKYTNEYIDDIYDDISFKIAKGEMLGYCGRDSFQVTKEWEVPEIGGALFSLKRHSEEHVEYELGNDQILIMLPEKDYRVMSTIKGIKQMEAVFISIYVYPALIYALSEMLHGKDVEAYTHFKWCKAIKDKLKTGSYANISDQGEHIPKIAQMIFNYPLTGSINEINSVIESFD